MRTPSFYAGKPVESLQTMLRQISDVDSRILPVVPDGQYGGASYASVRSIQEAFGLPVTGIADLKTWNLIVRVFDDTHPSRHIPAMIPQWSSGQSVAPGEFNYYLYPVQAMLSALADFFPMLPAPAVTGILDAATQEGLKWVQSASDLSPTGELNTATWHYLNAVFRATIGTGIKKKEA